MLGVRDQLELFELTNKLEQHHLPYTEFREPDLNNEITSVAFMANGALKGDLRKLPLLMKGGDT